MNPALLIKLRPTGPWRIGPDSGARNQVDAIYHSDTLYAAVTSAMLRLGLLQDWLGATSGDRTPAVCFSSCFPFLAEIAFIVPPRTIWPPSSPALLSARVRWKSARFVPLGIVQGLLSGQPLDEEQWSVDGPSGCLVPVGRSGPFRPGLRFNAAVDRLTGVADRHSVACLEFRPSAGLWTLVRFADPAARDRWVGPLRTAFRLLADSGFGGERSLGWGRGETPEFIEGAFPEMILAREVAQALPPANAEEVGQAILPPANAEQLTGQEAGPSEQEPPSIPDPEEGQVLPPANAEEVGQALPPANAEQLNSQEAGPTGPLVPYWLLSLFTPASTDSIDWTRGNYTVMIRAGRVDAPTRSGDLKRHLHMVAEGSVLYAASAPRGSAPDVAPEGFAHPVFRAGFAVCIPLPEASGTGQAGASPVAKVS